MVVRLHGWQAAHRPNPVTSLQPCGALWRTRIHRHLPGAK